MSYFDLKLIDGNIDVDTVRTEASDLADARHIALVGIRDILSHEVLLGELDLRGQIDITTTDGVWLASIPFAEALNIHKI